jgi:phage-related minor tail protein
MSNKTKEIAIITEGHSEKTIKDITNGFTDFFNAAKELSIQAKSVSVVDENDAEGMKKARELRLASVKSRKGAEKKKDELKAESIAYGKAVQANFNLLENFFKSHEADLLNLEETKKRAEADKIKKMIDERTSELRKIDPCINSSFYQFEKMSDDEFNVLLENTRLAVEKKEADRIAKEKAEKERIEKERIEKEEQEKKRVAEELRIKKENEELQAKLLQEREEREAEEAKRKEAEAKRIEAERIEREKREAEEAKKRAEIEDKLKKEKEERERLELEAKAAKEAEAKKYKDEQAAIQKIMQGNDKVKISSYVDQLKNISVNFECSSESGKTMILWATNKLKEIITNLDRGLETL